ncbi:hypothetical protein Plant_8 [Bacillus phage poppyseed]|uniref:Uncharacterized protein n=2 Tax=Bacillus phage Page TaxID=1406786 RepID=U5PVA5_9CAUD|nr:hypothetical protein Page_8 [Bacillus phage Page]AGY47930.1 hypothetical protein Page_8 [Bacillus phage Page]AGY48025.1 hypothetical protein Plant_8 [Bacillus phage poppyseed]
MGRWAANGTYVDNTVDVADFQSSGLVPTEEQARMTPQDKVLSAYSVSMGATVIVYTVPMDGFTAVGFNLYGSTSHSHKTTVWSMPDGTTQTGSLTSVDATTRGRNLLVDCPSNFAGLEIVNNHTAAVTYDLWVRKMNR